MVANSLKLPKALYEECFGRPRMQNEWYDVWLVSTTASDLPHEIETKRQPVNRNHDIKSHER